MEQKQEKLLSILMLPYLAHGHIYPFFELAKRLSARNFKIYICSSPANLKSIDRKEAEASSTELVELTVPSSPELPPPMHTTKDLPQHLISILLEAFQGSSASFLQVLEAKKPNLVIYDFVPSWAPKLASAKGIPAVFFGIVGSTPFAYHYHHRRPSMEDNDKVRSSFPSEAIYLLGHENFDGEEERDSMWDMFFGNLARSGEVALMKGCRAVEGKYADYLSSLVGKEVITTGPLIRRQGYDGGADDVAGDGVLKWLSGKEQSSTLYISFGSEHLLSEQEIHEIAKALELCGGVNFIWVLRFEAHGANDGRSSTSDKNLLQECLDKIKERGMIITGWAPQQKILAHPSVGGFLSHCGSNSINEAAIFGVPVIAMPIKYEQPINARLSVEAGFATEVAGKPAGIGWILNHYMGKDIAQGINKVFGDKEFGQGLRERAKELAQKIKEDEEDEVTYVADQLLKLCIKHKQGQTSLA